MNEIQQEGRRSAVRASRPALPRLLATNGGGSPLRVARTWIPKAASSIADQALFSGSHFLVSILLARWLTPEQYGGFAIAYTVFILLASLYEALLIEPMLVFGSGKYASRFTQYLSTLIYSHVWIAAVIVVVLAMASALAMLSGSKSLAALLFALAISSPMQQHQMLHSSKTPCQNAP